ISQTALVVREARQQVGLNLEVTLNGRALRDPRVALIQIDSRSRRDIRRIDFENSAPLVFDVGTPILEVLAVDVGGPEMPDIKVEARHAALAIGPGLIKTGQTIRISLLTDGSVALACPNPELADVIVRHRRSDIELEYYSVPTALASVPGAGLVQAI